MFKILSVHNLFLFNLFQNKQDNEQAGKRTTVKTDTVTKKKVVTKTHYSSPQTQSYTYMEKEINILKKISGFCSLFTDTTVSAPAYITSSGTKTSISVSTEYVDGVQLDTLPPEAQKGYVSAVLNFMELVSQSAHIKKLTVPYRSNWYFLIYLPVLCLRASLKHPKLSLLCIKSTVMCYSNFSYYRLKKTKLSLIHRDLFGSNCIVDQKKRSVTVLDWESAIFGDPIYEYALINWQYQGILSPTERHALAAQFCVTQAQLDHWKSLSHFVAIHALAIEEKNSTMTTQAVSLLYEMQSSKTLYEHLITFLLWFFEKINAYIPQRVHAGPLVLCYHSVGETGWRYSTPPKEFEKQMQWLKKQYDLVSLDTLVDNPQPKQLAITFDDGYLDVYTQAQPILKKYSIPATVFALGTPHHANRKEMDNDLPLMDNSHIIALKKEGWIIGHHTQTHIGLAAASDEQLNTEIVLGKKQAESDFGFTLSYFAYPKGAYSQKIINAVSKAGFSHAFTVDDKPVTPLGNNFLVDRVAVEGAWSIDQFRTVLSPLGLHTLRLLWNVLVLKDRILSSFH